MQPHERFAHLHRTHAQDEDFLQPDTLLARAASKWPHREALVCGDERITYEELYQRACQITHALATHDINRDAHVLLMYENSIPFFVCYYGIWQTGAVVAPLNTYLSEDELHHIIDDFQPSLIVTSETYRKKMENAGASAPIVTDTDLQTASSQTQAVNIPRRDPDAMAAILYTSGTTGYPKGVMLSSRNIITNCLQGVALFDIQEHERVLASLPLFHSFMQNACVWSPFFIGATTIVVPRVSRSHLLTGLSHGPTMLPTIPQMYGLLCRLRDVSLAGVKLCVSGGDALVDKVRMAVAMRFRRKICNGYGLTETSPFISVDLDDSITPANCIGTPMPGIAIDIRDDNGNTCQYGEVGTLWVRGDNVMLGYYNSPEKTREALQDGWLYTGDLALQTPGGRLMLCGRAKDLIIHKGRNIYPQEIENVLMNHPDVTMAGVLGKHEKDEEWPVAFVAASGKASHEELSSELRDLCRDHLAQYKVPIAIHVRKNLPTTTTGKVDKKQLKEEIS